LHIAADRPVFGYGSGSFSERYRKRERVVSSRSSAESHTIPITVAAEQGVIGLAAYGWLLWSAFELVFGGLKRTLRRRPAGVVLVARCVVASAFCALLLHTLVYAAFLEDPLTWTLLAMAAALRRVEPEAASPRVRSDRVASYSV
jgi:O-antigen ligase